MDKFRPAPTDGTPHRLDLRGLACPLPVLKSRKALAAMAQGDRLLVLSDDPVAAIDLPHFCVEAGHILVDATRQDDGSVLFLIERGEAG